MSQDIVERRLRSDAAQLLRMSEAVKFGADLSVRVTSPDLLIVSMVEGADEIGRLQALVQSMREALEPFAAVADEYDDSDDGAHQVWIDAGPEKVIRGSFDLSNYRRARAALSRSEV